MLRKKSRTAAVLFALLTSLALIACPTMAMQDDYESSGEFEKSKEEFGQTDEERPPVTFRFENESAPEPGKWGGYGGPMVNYLWLDMSALDPMTDDRGLDSFDDGLLTIGGMGGFVYSPIEYPGWIYVGGMGFGGSQSRSEDVGGNDRDADVSFGGGGVFIEYHYPISAKADISAGVMAGAGALTLSAEGDDILSGGDDSWDGSSSFFMACPYAGFAYNPLKWLRLEVTGGYLYFESDISGSDFEIDSTGMEMTDGDIVGGPQVSLRALFGWKFGE